MLIKLDLYTEGIFYRNVTVYFIEVLRHALSELYHRYILSERYSRCLAIASVVIKVRHENNECLI